MPAGDDQVQLYARRAQIAAPGRSFRPGPRRPGYARPEAPDGLALSRRPLLAGSILGGLCGLALAVFASGSLVGPQGLWASAAISEEEQAPAPAAAELQPLAPEDHSRARTAAPLPAVHVRTDPVRSTPAAYVPAPKLAGPELAATEPEAVPEQQSDSGSGAVRWDLLYERAHDHQRKGDLAAATDLFGEAARLQPAHPAILYDWGYALQLQGRWQDAIDRYRQAIAVDPDHPYAHYNLGALLHRRGDEAGALESYRRSAELRPDNPALHLDWGSLLEHRGDLAGAAEHYRRAADLAPQSGPGMDARRRLARIDPSW